jgi:hypothetical protein
VVRRNTQEVQGRGNFELFDELFDPDFVDHTPQLESAKKYWREESYDRSANVF